MEVTIVNDLTVNNSISIQFTENTIHFTFSNATNPLKSTKEVSTSCEDLEELMDEEKSQHHEIETEEEAEKEEYAVKQEEDQTAMEIDIDNSLLKKMIQRQEELKEEKEEIERRLTELQSRFENIDEELEDMMYLMD